MNNYQYDIGDYDNGNDYIDDETIGKLLETTSMYYFFVCFSYALNVGEPHFFQRRRKNKSKDVTFYSYT